MNDVYSCIDELKIALDLRVDKVDKKKCLDEAGKDFYIDEEQHWFVVAENGECALFDKDCKIDNLSKVKKITNEMIRVDIKSIIIPDSVESIGEWAFANCKSLESINIPDSVKIIGEYAFWVCKSLENVVIPGSVKNIGNNAFKFCKSIKKMLFKRKTLDEVKSMDNYPWGIEDRSIIKLIKK